VKNQRGGFQLNKSNFHCFVLLVRDTEYARSETWSLGSGWRRTRASGTGQW